jgi:hypothetical protein
LLRGSLPFWQGIGVLPIVAPDSRTLAHRKLRDGLRAIVLAFEVAFAAGVRGSQNAVEPRLRAGAEGGRRVVIGRRFLE